MLGNPPTCMKDCTTFHLLCNVALEFTSLISIPFPNLASDSKHKKISTFWYHTTNFSDLALLLAARLYEIKFLAHRLKMVWDVIWQDLYGPFKK